MASSSEQMSVLGPAPKASDLLLDQKRKTRGLSMDAHTDKERDMERVQEGVEAFNRDLEGFLRAKKLHHVAAYEGGTLIAMAPTRRRLERKLAKLSDLKRSDLFVACISPPDEADDLVMSL